MAYRFLRQRVRVAVDLALKKGPGAIVDVISGESARFARGAAVQIEVGLLYNGKIIDISNISAVTCEIKQINDPDATLAMTKTIGSTSMNPALTDADWATGEADKAHFAFTWLSTETVDSVFGTPAKSQDAWLVLWGFTNDAGADKDVFGVGTVNTFDAGVSGSVVAPPASQNGITLDQLSAYLQDYLKKINDPGVTCTFVSPTTQKRVKLGADDNGDFLSETQVTT